MSVNRFQSELPTAFIFPQHLQHGPAMENQASGHQFNSPLYTRRNQPWPVNDFNLNRRSNVLEEELDDPAVADCGEDSVATAREWEESEDRESMFEKALTPSDVGKLNRLVIPKQHAEKYFPLGGAGDSGDKGLLLSFEDEAGKSWRFRYSYWNSSQSYVLTKGWSRYVKEKRLESGDVVFFQRHQTIGDRLFIGLRRRPVQDSSGARMAQECEGNSNGGARGWTRCFYSAHPYPVHSHHQHHLHHAGSASAPSPAASAGNSRILRLFGVNMDVSGDPSAALSDLTPPDSRFFPQLFSSNPANHMDSMFSQDVNRRRNSRG